GYYNSDIDIFVHGYDDVVAATDRVQRFCSDIQAKVGDKILFARTRNSLTIVREYPLRQIQVIFRLYKSPSEVLMGFDIDCCCVGYDGKEVYGIPRFFEAITYQRNVVDVTRRSPSYEYRLYKYSKRGFGVLIPGRKVDISKVDVNEDNENSLTGLPRLVSLSKGFAKKLYSRYDDADEEDDSSSNESLQIKDKMNKVMLEMVSFDDYVKLAHGDIDDFCTKKRKGNLLPDLRTTELIDIDRYTEVHSFKYSNYMTIKIPYSPNWDLMRIKCFVRYLNSAFAMNRNYGSFDDMELSPALTGDDEDDYEIPDCVEIAMSSDQVLQVDLGYIVEQNGKEMLSQYSPAECWLIDNPGRQMLTGSFHPIFSDMDAWIKGEETANGDAAE
ncbi:hypothetical protein HDV01_003381, partial [Terramyces sp. JEL0728]